MKTFKEFYAKLILSEEDNSIKSYKGWMNPAGTPHLFNSLGEHANNHHPDLKGKIGSGIESIKQAQKLGYTRFANHRGTHSSLATINYDHSAPKGNTAALHALNYMKPDKNTTILVNNKGGLGASKTRLFATHGEAARHIRGVKK